jgi:antitoxin component YwqK of YwqJK toxin-antitoxin module/tetratricopeptide (TPR) repeat protein
MKRFVSTIAVISLFSINYAQKNAVKSNYYQDYVKANIYINQEKFDDARDLLEEIPEQDSLFLKAQYRLQLMYSRSENYPKVVEIGERMSQLPFESGHQVFNAWAHSLANMEKYEEALEIIDLGLTKFSESHLLHYRRGLILQDLKRHQEALHAYQRAIQAYPLHVYSHVKLGEMAAHEGRFTQALMSLAFATMFEEDPQYKASIHMTMEKISTMDFEAEPKNIVFDEGDDFGAIDKIIETKVALLSRFKLQSKLKTIAYTRQLQVIMEALKYDSGADGFWMQHYAPMFTGIYNAKLFDAFTYISIIGPNYGTHSAPAYKQKKRLAAFYKWLVPNVGKYIARQVIEFEGKKQETFIDLGSSNISARGIGKDFDDRNGIWELFDGISGRPIGEGLYKDGKRNGEWVIYDEATGLLSQRLTFVDDELEGPITIYYENGKPEAIVNMKKGERDGQRIIFFPSGDTMLIDNHIMGKRTGNYTSFHENNTIKLTGYLKDDKWDGLLKEYHTNGNLSAEIYFKDDKKDGTSTIYYRNGKIAEKANYKLDKKVDEFESFYNNGQLASKGRYKNDNQVGKWVAYYYDGKLKEEAEYDENGKKNSITKTFDRDGKIHHEMEYKNGELLSYKFFNKDGKIIAQEKKSGKKINYKFYDPRGILITEGQLVNDEKTGQWIYYNDNGVKETEHNYDKGKINGKSKSFFPNGEVELIENYVDDELDGLVMIYYPNGELKTEGYFAKGKRTGMWYYYYQDGTLSDKEYYVEDEVVGWSEDYTVKGVLFTRSFNFDGDIRKTVYFDIAGNPIDTIHYYHGEVIVPNPNGKDILSKQNFKNDVRHGQSQSFYLGTRLSFSGEYFNGRRNGLFVEYHPNGQKSVESTYTHGQLNGLYSEYRWNGNLSFAANYKDGILDGEATYYHPDGSLHYKMNYVDNEAHGEVIMKMPSGEVYAIFYYDRSVLVGYSYLDKNGNAKPMIELEKEDKIICYYKNGTKSLETKLMNGEYHGAYTIYDTKGVIFENKTYVYGEIDGLATYNSEPNKPYNTINFSMGVAHGEMKLYHLNGKILLETSFHYGTKNGVEKEYDQNGKLKFTREYYNGVLISEKKH